MARSSVVALLPMKAHSERVTGKNFRSFAGKPLFRWMLDTLLSVDVIDKVVINTDAEEILSQHGLNQSERLLIRKRPEAICGDHVSMNLVIEDDVRNVDADTYLMTHTTNPFLTSATIRGALRAFSAAHAEGRADSLFTVNKVQTRFYRGDGTAVNHDPDNLIRTQDLEPWYEENSNLYIFTRDSFTSNAARIGKMPLMYESPKLESIDIDTPEDWEFGAAIAEYYLREGNDA